MVAKTQGGSIHSSTVWLNLYVRGFIKSILLIKMKVNLEKFINSVLKWLTLYSHSILTCFLRPGILKHNNLYLSIGRFIYCCEFLPSFDELLLEAIVNWVRKEINHTYTCPMLVLIINDHWSFSKLIFVTAIPWEHLAYQDIDKIKRRLVYKK